MSTTAGPLSPPPATSPNERRQTLLAVLPVIGGICLAALPVLKELPHETPWELAAFAAAGLGMLLFGALLLSRRIGELPAAYATIGLAGALLLLRLTMMFTGSLFDDPSRSLFMTVYGYYATYYLAILLLLPYPQSARVGVAAWLAMAAITTLGTHPYWHAQPPRQLLSALLLYVWLGHGLFLLLLFSWARRQHTLLQRYAGLIESERATRAERDAAALRFCSLIDQAAVGMALIDARGHWQQVNARLCDITGYSADELMATDMSLLTLPEDQAGLAERRQAFVADEIESYSVERRCLRRDGSVIWLQIYLRKAPATAQLPAHGVLVVVDIHERKRAEQRAAEHQRVREFHVDNTPLGVIEWTPDFRIKRWSRRAEAMFGWSEAEVLGRHPLDWRFIHDDDREMTEKALAPLFTGEAALVSNLNRNYRKDGSVVWCHWYNSALRDDEGGLLSLFTMVNDVSEQQTAITALHESETQWRSIFEQAAVGIAMLDAQGAWLTVNQRLCEIAGYTRDELLALDIQALTHPEDRRANTVFGGRVAGGSIDHYSLEQRCRHRDGSVVWIMLFVRRIDATATTPMRFVAVIEDISERKRAEASVRQLTASLETTVAERTLQLRQTMRNWQRSNAELAMLADMMGVLPAARDSAEANRVAAQYLPKLFARCRGALYLEDGAADRFVLQTQWGDGLTARPSLIAEDCWALRRGQPLRVEDSADPLLCPHLGDGHVHGAQQPHACMPVTALGKAVGLIYLQWPAAGGVDDAPPDNALLSNTAEQIGLAIGNVRLREELRRQATRDPLTGLYNRRNFDECLARRVAESARSGRGFALLLLDIDHFKDINDRHGHDIGDEVLRETGALLQRIVRADESAFRLGGEEFVLMINDGSGSQAGGCAERVRREVENLRGVRNGKPLPLITVSIGVTCCPEDSSDAVALMQRADAALYAAKRTGRNRVCYAGTVPGSASAIAVVHYKPA